MVKTNAQKVILLPLKIVVASHRSLCGEPERAYSGSLAICNLHSDVRIVNTCFHSVSLSSGYTRSV